MNTFDQLGLPASLVRVLTTLKITSPTPVQAAAIPPALQGKDVLASAQTGTGKTFAYALPLATRLMQDPDSMALVLVPTRELAVQVVAALRQLHSKDNPIKTALLIGGDSMPKQLAHLRQRPRVIVGTPGRIQDHIDRGTLSLKKVHILAIDEVDRMLDMGFSIQIENIIRHVPEERQTLMFSATMPSNMMRLAHKYLRDPQRISIDSTTKPVDKIKQDIVYTSAIEKFEQLCTQLGQRTGSVLIFVKTKRGADQLAGKLNRAKEDADAIHGNLSQRKRDRVLRAFRNYKSRILVATDIAARGLDIHHIEHVINYDLPQCPEDYIHRIGRTARAGAEGSALCLISPEDKRKWYAIDRLMNPEKAREHREQYGSRSSRGGFRGRSGGSGGRRSNGGWSRSSGNGGRRSNGDWSRSSSNSSEGGDSRSGGNDSRRSNGGWSRSSSNSSEGGDSRSGGNDSRRSNGGWSRSSSNGSEGGDSRSGGNDSRRSNGGWSRSSDNGRGSDSYGGGRSGGNSGRRSNGGWSRSSENGGKSDSRGGWSQSGDNRRRSSGGGGWARSGGRRDGGHQPASRPAA